MYVFFFGNEYDTVLNKSDRELFRDTFILDMSSNDSVKDDGLNQLGNYIKPKNFDMFQLFCRSIVR